MGDILVTIPSEMVEYLRDGSKKIRFAGMEFGPDHYYGTGNKELSLQEFLDKRVIGMMYDEQGQLIEDATVFVNLTKGLNIG